MEVNQGECGVAWIARVGSLVTAIVALSCPIVFAQVPSGVCGVPGWSSTVAPPCTHSWVTTSGFFIRDGDATTGPSSATATDGFGADSLASTDFNLTHLAATTTASTGPRSESRFLDTFEVSGGAGTGTATFHWSLIGTLQQFTPPAVCDLFRDGVDFSLGAVSRSLAFTTLPLCTAETRTINRSGSFAITFTYGVPFLQGLTLYAEAPNGLVNLTARITTIDLPAGAILTSGSGTAYPVTASSPTVLLTSLVTFVQALNLSSGIANSLDAKLQNVLDALDAAHAGDVISACHRLDAFINEVAAQAGNKLTETQAAQLTLRAQNVRVALGCG